jgi:hypothetical protein
MVKPVDGQASLNQAQNALELAQTVQRLAELAQARQRLSDAAAQRVEHDAVVKQEEAKGRTIRDDDPRQSHKQKRSPKDEQRPPDEEKRPQDHRGRHIDLEI